MRINVLEYLEQSANSYPEKIALKDETGEITFSQFEKYSRSIGSAIIEVTAASVRQPVIVMVDRTSSSIIAFMGTLYSGNFYVPVDNQTPKQRLQLIIDTLNPKLILCEEKDAGIFEGIQGAPGIIIIGKACSHAINNEQLNEAREKIIDTDPVYTIFTSGSTGTPKGIVVSHKSVIDLAEWLDDTFGFSNEDVIGNQTPFYFDASVKDIYICIKKGVTICIIPKQLFMFPIKLVEYMNNNRITTVLWATSAITLIANSKIFKKSLPVYLNKIFFAGEAMFAKHINAWRKYLPDAKYVNLYGPTEATVDCTYYIVNREFNDDEVIPIGNACRNMEVMLLDDERKLISDGQSGEICVRGTGVAMGYINDPALSGKVFIQNPLNSSYRDILYCTGDIARYNEYGEIVFISRKDGQVKHMGNRIELGEIEAAVNAVGEIKACICFYDRDASKIVLDYIGNIEKAELITKLNDKLPKYMIPNILERFETFPYNANGKIDRRKLVESYNDGKG